MWHVAPESTSQQVLGSPIPTYKILQCAAQVVCHGLSLDPPASDPVFTAKDLTTITALFPSSCSPSGSSSPSSTSLSFPPFPRPFAAFALCSRLGLGLCRRFRWKLTLLVVCWDPWPSSPQLCDLTCRMAAFHRLWAFTSFVPSLPQLWQVRASEPCFGLVATCTLLSRSLVSLIRVWYATTDSQTLTLPRSYSPEGGAVLLQVSC